MRNLGSLDLWDLLDISGTFHQIGLCEKARMYYDFAETIIELNKKGSLLNNHLSVISSGLLNAL